MPRRKSAIDSDPPLDVIARQIKVTNVLLAAGLLQHMKQTDVIGLLKSTGVTIQEIASILGTSYGVVAVTLGRLKRKAEQHGDEIAEADFRVVSQFRVFGQMTQLKRQIFLDYPFDAGI